MNHWSGKRRKAIKLLLTGQKWCFSPWLWVETQSDQTRRARNPSSFSLWFGLNEVCYFLDNPTHFGPAARAEPGRQWQEKPNKSHPFPMWLTQSQWGKMSRLF
jgi:hypothetical protein